MKRKELGSFLEKIAHFCIPIALDSLVSSYYIKILLDTFIEAVTFHSLKFSHNQES
jgi:hypothetical protein